MISRTVVRRTMLAGAAMTLFAGSSPALASQFWVNGDAIYYSGETQANDGERLKALYDELAASGRTITRVVFRNAPGGAAIGGYDMANFIREKNLNTVFQGGCYSACALAFSGGIERSMVEFDLPAIYTTYDRNTLGYHGASIGGVPADDEVQQFLYDFAAALLEPQLTDGAAKRIYQAHFGLEDSQGFLRYLDPAKTTGASTIFCPTGGWVGGDLTGCSQYAGTTMYTDGVVTTPGYTTVSDILKVTGTVSGDLNPNYRTSKDSFGVVRIAEGGVWNLNTKSSAYMTWISNGGTLNLQASGRVGRFTELVVGRGGTVNLQGGTLVTGIDIDGLLDGDSGVGQQPVAVFGQGSSLQGTGALSGTMYISGTLAPTDIVVRPYADRDKFSFIGYQSIELQRASTTAFSVSSATTTAAFRNERAEVSQLVGAFGTDDGLIILGVKRLRVIPVVISSGASLAVDFKPGFYRPGQAIPLMQGVVDPRKAPIPTSCTQCVGFDDAEIANYLPDTFFSGRYSNFIRSSDGARITLDRNAVSQVVAAGEDSLLGFDLVYTNAPDVPGLVIEGYRYSPDLLNNFSALTLVARPAFERTAIFANAASGDGLGQALRTASNLASPGNSDLLGALQFARASVATAQSGNLRGDGHATQLLADAELVRTIDAVQRTRIADLRSGRGATPLGGMGMLGMGSANDPTSVAAKGAALVDAMATQQDAAAVATADIAPGDTAAATGAPAAGQGARQWGRVFSGRLKTDAGQGVAGLRTEYIGFTLGLDRQLPDGNGALGISASYLSADNRATDRYAYAAGLDAVSGSIYGTLDHGAGSIAGSVRVTHLSHDTSRRVGGISGLEAPVKADFGTTVLSAQVDNVFDVAVGGPAQLRIYAPVATYQRTMGGDRTETGGAIALDIDADAFQTARVGAGAELARAFTTARGTVTPYVRVAYDRELADVTARLDAGFASQRSQRFAVRSQTLGRDIGRVDIGITSVASDNFSITLQYQGQFRDGQTQHGGLGGIAVKF